jgi:hypothetical protein
MAAKVRFADISGGAAVPADVEERAHELLDQMGATQEDAEGIRSLQNLTLSIGLTAARECFYAMLDANAVSPALRASATREIKAFSPITEIGCMRVDFFNMLTAKADVRYLVLEKCPSDHNLGAQLQKLKSIVDMDKWVEVVKHLSMLVYLGRSTYAQLAALNKPLLRRIYKRADDDECADLMALGVDSRNTTLFVDPRWPVRIGIFVRTEDEK